MGGQQAAGQAVMGHDGKAVRLLPWSTLASVTMAPIVVAVVFMPFSRMCVSARRSGEGKPRPPNSPFCSKGAAQKCGPSPTVAEPTALTATMAAMRQARCWFRRLPSRARP